MIDDLEFLLNNPWVLINKHNDIVCSYFFLLCNYREISVTDVQMGVHVRIKNVL